MSGISDSLSALGIILVLVAISFGLRSVTDAIDRLADQCVAERAK